MALLSHRCYQPAVWMNEWNKHSDVSACLPRRTHPSSHHRPRRSLLDRFYSHSNQFHLVKLTWKIVIFFIGGEFFYYLFNLCVLKRQKQQGRREKVWSLLLMCYLVKLGKCILHSIGYLFLYTCSIQMLEDLVFCQWKVKIWFAKIRRQFFAIYNSGGHCPADA